jgi:hypothetical protein
MTMGFCMSAWHCVLCMGSYLQFCAATATVHAERQWATADATEAFMLTSSPQCCAAALS